MKASFAPIQPAIQFAVEIQRWTDSPITIILK